MIFLSAQPSEFYFVWQIEVQINNFAFFGIKKSSIHILIGYEANVGISADFLDLASRYKNHAFFFFYPDKRVNRNYIPSLRPNIIKQHFAKNRYLEEEIIFFHDCDIVFTHSLPNFSALVDDHCFYFSDARAYIDSHYIRRASDQVFEDMCRIIQIDPQLVRKNDPNAGGAQYLLKNINLDFWAKVESDCEKLYVHLVENDTKYRRIQATEGKDYMPINSWCSDMWALLWNSFKIAEVRISEELNFCWPHQQISMWKNKIYHNAGVEKDQSQKLFYKQAFKFLTPFECDLNHLIPSVCSYNYAKAIMQLDKKKHKYHCPDTTIILISEIRKKEDILLIKETLNFLATYFEIDVVLVKVTHKDFPLHVDSNKISAVYSFEKGNIGELSIKDVVKGVKTQIIVEYNITQAILFPPCQIYRGILNIRHEKTKVCIPYDGSIKKINKKIYFNLLKRFCGLVLSNYYPSKTESRHLYEGCVIISKSVLNLLEERSTSFSYWTSPYINLMLNCREKGIDVSRIEGFACIVLPKRMKEKASSNKPKEHKRLPNGKEFH